MTEAETKIEPEFDKSKLGAVLGEGDITVTEDVILRYSKAIGETDPKYTTPGPELLAPPGIVTVLQAPQGERVDIKFPFAKTGMHGGSAIYSYAPIRAGEKLHVTTKLADVFVKTGRSGPMGFTVRQYDFAREDGTVVARVTDTNLSRP